jgi:hypothetical protein
LPDIGADARFQGLIAEWVGHAIVDGLPCDSFCYGKRHRAKSETGGNNRPDLLLRAGESSARHLAAAMNMASVTRRALTDKTPKPIPGKMYELFV